MSKILIRTNFTENLQKATSTVAAADTEEKYDIDIRFGAESEETAPSTQRQVIDQEDSASLHKYSHQYSPKAIHYATIDNFPRNDLALTHPPLRTEYPTALQNNFIPKARIAYQPTATHYSTPPQLPATTVTSLPPTPPAIQLPSSLANSVHPVVPNYAYTPPSVVPLQSTYTQYASSSSSPNTILPPTSSVTNLNNLEQSSKANSREKVVVKIVPATGWYLNDAAERRSYYDAVSRGLLRENGYVFVNDVQRPQAAQQHNIVRRSTVQAAPFVDWTEDGHSTPLTSISDSSNGSASRVRRRATADCDLE